MRKNRKNRATSNVSSVAIGKPVKLDARFLVSHSTKGQTITLNSRAFVEHTCTAAFMFVWLVGWSIGCVALACSVIHEFRVVTLIFSIPFFVGWFFGAGVFLHAICGNEQIVIGVCDVEIKKSCIVQIFNRVIPLKEIVDVKVVCVENDGSKSYHVEMVTIGRTVSLGNSLSEETLDNLAAYLRQEIPGVGSREVRTLAGDQKSVEAPANLQALEPRKRQPSDCRWDKAELFGGETAFVNIAKFELQTVIGLLLVTLFWNGIVAVFLLEPFFPDSGMLEFEQLVFEIAIFLFLIPFVLVGLGLIGLLVLSVLEPFRTTYVRFTQMEIIRTHRYFGIPFTRRRAFKGQIDMTLVEEKKQTARFKIETASAGNLFTLCFLHKKQEAFRWKYLTRGEAEWIATLISQEQSAYRVAH